MVNASTVESNIEINEKEGYVIISINPKIYPLDVVLSSAYVFTEKYYCLVDGDPKEEIIVEMRPKTKKGDLKKMAREFNNELINYANYAVQSLKNQILRESIITRVLETHTIPSEEFDNYENVPSCEDEVQQNNSEKSWFDDPEGIAIPWDEKYGGNAQKKDTLVDDTNGLVVSLKQKNGDNSQTKNAKSKSRKKQSKA